MAFDAVLLSAVLQELSPVIAGAKLDKIQQPEKDKLILSLRGSGQSVRLLLSARPGAARLHLTQTQYENPQSPPMFCMLLRKHLSGARLTAVTQPPMERIVRLEFDTYNAMGEPSKKYLLVECMGKYANVVLTDAGGMILDALRRVDEDMSRDRRLLPGLLYRLPPDGGKRNPLDTAVTEADLFKTPELRPDQWLLDIFFGLSPLTARELSFRALGDMDVRIGRLSQEAVNAYIGVLNAHLEKIREKSFAPYLLLEGDKPVDYSYMPIEQYGAARTCQRAASFSQMLEQFYMQRDRADRMRQKSGALTKTVTALRDRTARRLGMQREELKATGERERMRQMGDIVTANLYRMEKGQKTLVAADFFDPDCKEATIRLDPLKTPQQNAALYYKKYTKLKTAEAHLRRELERGEAELAYLNSTVEVLSKAETSGDVEEVRRELVETGVLKKQKKTSKKEKRIVSSPLRFRSSAGLEILVGKNNLQNDELTFHTAHKADLWLHAQKIHGSHVIVRCNGAPDDASVKEAAVLAAYYSQGRDGQKIPVDYTQVRHVKRQAGGKPGMVFYTDQKTVIVTPDGEAVRRLEEKN